MGLLAALEAPSFKGLFLPEKLLLRALTQAGEHQAAYAVDRLGNRTILNRAASFEIGPADYANLWPLVRRAMATSTCTSPIRQMACSGAFATTRPAAIGPLLAGHLFGAK